MTGQWDDLATRTFKPREVENITEVNTEQQRLWMKRYGFDFRHVRQPEGGFALWNWTGVQQLASFKEIFSDTKDPEFARAMIGMGEDERVSTAQLFDHDLRERADGDMLLYGHFEVNMEVPDNRYGAGNGKTISDLYQLGRESLRPERLYLFNLSSMQRRLSAKIGLD